MLNFGRQRGCLWPMWPHGDKPSHEYCGARRAEDSSYCKLHKKMSIRDSATEPRTVFVPRKRAA